MKLSKLTEVAVSPKPIERQSVQTCLRVLCEDTILALEIHPVIDNTAVLGTTNFIKLVVKLWKIFNVRSSREDQEHNDPLRAVIRMPDNPRLQFLLEVAIMADEIIAVGGGGAVAPPFWLKHRIRSNSFFIGAHTLR